ncbi:MAG: hypothetical protein GX020_08175 [Firmicutes bacterium]|nr:hypothetical protein [Bacillota bacterium]
MRALILHTEEPKTIKWANALRDALATHNCKVDLVVAKENHSTPIGTSQYRLIIMLSNFSGLFKPKLPNAVDDALKQCSRVQGKRGAAFLPAKLGSTKALKNLMEKMEQQGIFVEDFGAIRNQVQVEKIAERLMNLLNP